MRCRRITRLRTLYRELRAETREGAAPQGALDSLRGEYEEERDAFDGCVRELEALDAAFISHDPVTLHLLGELGTGLRVVLCWTVGEKKVAYFHPLGLEDAPRQPLDPSLPAPLPRAALPAPSLRPDA